MAKSHKRICEVSGTNEVEASISKKIKISGGKTVNRKAKNHSVSSIEDEESDRNSTRKKNKGHGDKNKPNRNLLNTHLLSSESDCVGDLSFEFTPNKITLENSVGEYERVVNSECESEIDLNVKNTQKATSAESDSKERDSSRRMAKIHKRKREVSVTDEVEASNSKKIKIYNEQLVHKTIKRKEKTHSVSSSEGEESGGKNTRIESKGDKNKSNTNLTNSHLLSSDCDSVRDVSHEFASNNMSLENSVSDYENSGNEVDGNSERNLNVKNTQKATSTKYDNRERLHQIPKFTHDFNEEISKFSLLLDDNLIEKNDIWILQCPSNMNCSTLVNQRLGLGNSCELYDGERSYETYSYRNTSARCATLAVPNERNHLNLYKIPITGNIIVEESVKTAKNAQETIPEPPSRVELPENLRTRHPLLGIDFSKQPRTAERVPEKRPKKKKHSKNHDRSYNGLLESEFGSPSISTSSKKKKKKQERSNDVVSQSDYAEQFEEEAVDDSVRKKKKKKKHKES